MFTIRERKNLKSQSTNIHNHQKESKGVQRHNQEHFLHMGLQSHENKPHNIIYVEGPLPQYNLGAIIYNPKQTEQDVFHKHVL